MPLMWKESIEAGATANPGMHFLTEDPRPGHNVMYFGQGKNAYDSVSLKPLWGLSGTFKQDNGTSYYGGAFDAYHLSTAGEQTKKTYMLLAGAHPMGYGRNLYNTTITNGATWNNVHASSFQNMDTEQKPTQHFIKDNGDGTHDLLINSMEHGMFGGAHEFYSEGHYYASIPDDLELYDVTPNGLYVTSASQNFRGIPCGYSALDGTNSGFVTMSHQNSSYPTYASLKTHSSGAINSESNGGSTGSTNGYYSQFAGMSRSDGLPIFFEYRHSLYTAFFRVTKWSGSSWSTLLSSYYGGNNQTRWRYISNSYSYSSSTSTEDHAAGSGDSQLTLASCWFRKNTQGANHYYTIVPFGYQGVPYFDIIRWDRASDTFAGAGMQGISTQYASVYHVSGAGANGWQGWNGYVAQPFEARREKSQTTATSSGHSGTEQALAYAIAADAHGFTNADGSTEYPFETEDYPGGGDIIPVTTFNMSPVDGAFDSNAKGRAMFLTTSNSDGAAYNSAWKSRAVTQVPETPIDWVWCDSGKTTIAAICKNATYIYQCRKGASFTSGTGNTTDSYPGAGSGYNTSEFNYTAGSNGISWVHTATIPYQVMQMGIDKHDRLWYITHSAAGGYIGKTVTNDQRYHKQMWMLTTATPHKVNLTGNATTDTISYSGSNIDKTLTIEALNFKGQRLAKTITLNITSTNAQFDNGSQTKDVTTSASATVNETITVTGAGSFNITAAYGA